MENWKSSRNGSHDVGVCAVVGEVAPKCRMKKCAKDTLHKWKPNVIGIVCCDMMMM